MESLKFRCRLLKMQRRFPLTGTVPRRWICRGSPRQAVPQATLVLKLSTFGPCKLVKMKFTCPPFTFAQETAALISERLSKGGKLLASCATCPYGTV